MAQLVYKPGQRRHLVAVRHLPPAPNDAHCYVAGSLVGIYTSTSSPRSGQESAPAFGLGRF